MKPRKQIQTYILHYKGHLLGEMESLKLFKSINLLRKNGVKHLILDISRVELINTPGVLFLAEIFFLFKQHQGSFRIKNPQNQIKNVINVMKLQPIIKL